MDLPPPMWLTFSHQAQSDLIAQLGELLHRHLHAQRIGGVLSELRTRPEKR